MEKKPRLKIQVYNAQKKSIDELTWCALCHEVKPLFWKDGKLLCYEMKFYPKGSRLVVLESCVADMPKYSKTVRVEGAANIPSTILPVVKASGVAEKVLNHTLTLLKAREKPRDA